MATRLPIVFWRHVRAVTRAAAFASVMLISLCMPSMARTISWGINGHPLNNYRGVTTAQQLDYVKDIGLTSYRVDVIDERSVPTLKTLVREAKARGIEILPVITPSTNLNAHTTDEIYQRAYDRAVAIVTPLKNDIRVWELGNEVENYAIIRACEKRDNGERYDCTWGPAGGLSPLDYYGPRWAKASAMLRGLADGVKSVDPTIRRAMGTAGWGHTGAFERMRADGLEWEISVWHMYGQDPEWAFKILAGYGKPIWVTEFNHPGGSSDGASAQADGLVRQMRRLKELAGTYNIEAAHIYELMDEPYWAPSYEAVMGLVTLERSGPNRWHAGKPKAAYLAAQTFLAGNDLLAAAPAGLTEYTAAKRDCQLPQTHAGDRSVETRIVYAYCLVLGRNPDGGGLHSWVTKLQQPTPTTEMLEAMIVSSEFVARYQSDRMSNREFVALLYRLLLMREPDGGGLAEYQLLLDDNRRDRLDTARALLKSYEFSVRHPVLAVSLQPTSPSSQ